MPEDEFERYLTLLAKTLRLSDVQRDAIAAELRDHMEARLHELTLQGVERDQAIETALAEFGDASGLAKDLTRTNPERTRTRRHFMQTTFGTIAACAAVTFAVMLLVPNNKSGQPNQPAAVAQGDGFGEPGLVAPGGFDAGAGFGGPGDAAEGEFDEFGGGPRGFGGFEAGAAPQPKLELAIHVVDCTEILRADRDRGDLLDRTAALANAVEQTVATVNAKGNRAIRVQPFEEFLIITATDSAYEEAHQLLDNIKNHVARREAVRKQGQIEQQQALELQAKREQAQAALHIHTAKLAELERRLELQTSGQNPEAEAIKKQIEETQKQVEKLRNVQRGLGIEKHDF